MTTFATLKKTPNILEKLAKEIEKINTPVEKTEDTRFWYPEVDKAGNGTAIIRFLPSAAVDGDDSFPWVRIFNHGFKGPTGKWYIENSLTTLGQSDPVSDYNSTLWNISSDDTSPGRKQAREQKRRLNYIANIYVKSDPKTPENEGKVKLFRFGKKIFDKITLLMNPEFEDDKPVNPFDLWNGADLKIRIRNVEGYRNYDQSTWLTPGPLDDNDKKMEEIWKQEYSLKEFIDPKHFKSYDELKKKLNDVMGFDSSKPTLVKTAPKAPKALPVTDDDVPFEVDEDEDLAAFKSLAESN
jgi:hypothetical protein